MKITPINKKLIIKRIKKDEKKGALLLLSEVEKYESFFQIIQVSSDCDGDLKIGHKVYIDRYSNHPIEGQEDIYILRQENVIAIVE